MNARRQAAYRPEVDLRDVVDELTRPHTNRTRYETQGRGRSMRSRYNQVRVPSLLHQLEHAVPTSSDNERSTGGYESRPTYHIEALDTFLRIDHEARVLLEQRNLTASGSTAACVRRLHALARTDRRLARELRRWYAQARVITGWDSPPWRPDATCPMCDERRTLRVRWHEEVALCTACFETWDATNIGLLADHVRLEAEHGRRSRPPVPACFCPLPMPQPTTLRLCPTCGSARCIRALTQPYDTPKENPGA